MSTGTGSGPCSPSSAIRDAGAVDRYDPGDVNKRETERRLTDVQSAEPLAPETFTALVTPHLEYLYAFAYKLCGERTAAEDVMSNYHYAINSAVPNGTHVGKQANWGAWVYYCSGSLASKKPHVHTEAAEVTNFSDTWSFGTSAPNYPFISYTQP